MTRFLSALRAPRRPTDRYQGKEAGVSEGCCSPIASKCYPLLMEVPSSKVAVDWALSFLGCMRLLAQHPCIVLDIDGTVLLNDSEGSTRCVLHFQALAQTCRMHGIAVFCITARPDEPENRVYTERQLQKCGILPVAALYMRPVSASYQRYKFRARQEITKSGYTILLAIGDQFADISISEPPSEILDDKIYVGQIGDNMQFGIKLASEFA